MPRLRDVIAYLDTTLEIGRFKDYGPNGLQVEGAAEVTKIITGVSASAELIARAIETGANLIVVHHGLIWGSGLTKIAGTMARRLKLLLANDISLAAYHLPLDKHERLGNNAGLADALGLGPDREAFGELRGMLYGVAGTWSAPLSRDEAVARVTETVCGGQQPPFVFAHGPEHVRKVGLCTGAASDLLEEAVAAGCDMYITGELAERAADLAKELGITLVAAGHVATEVFGPLRLADELRARFAVDASFVRLANPL